MKFGRLVCQPTTGPLRQVGALGEQREVQPTFIDHSKFHQKTSYIDSPFLYRYIAPIYCTIVLIVTTLFDLLKSTLLSELSVARALLTSSVPAADTTKNDMVHVID